MSAHIGIVSILFDHKPEGICTGRLVRALLDRHRLSIYTSGKAKTAFQHPRLEYLVAGHRPRKPAALFRALAHWRGEPSSNFYLWGRRVAHLCPSVGIPDCFYGRAWPHGSLVAAAALARQYQRPLLLHFSDPFPPPNEAEAGQRFMADLQRMVDQAVALTFTNEETVAYQRRFLHFDRDKAFVLNHIGPPAKVFGPPETNTDFYYLGAVGPTRPADILLAGFHRYRQRHGDARLVFVGSSAEYLRSIAPRCGGLDNVEILPFTAQVEAKMRAAAVLLSLDADIHPAVFTSTKIVEYLRVDRPVLAITPAGSPVDKLMTRAPDTTVVVNRYQVDAGSRWTGAGCHAPL